MRPNQALKLTGKAWVHFTARWKVNMFNYGFGVHTAIVQLEGLRYRSLAPIR